MDDTDILVFSRELSTKENSEVCQAIVNITIIRDYKSFMVFRVLKKNSK